MSTEYRLAKDIRAADLLDGRLATCGVREHVAKDTTPTFKCLTDGRNYLWMYADENGFVTGLKRTAGNAAAKIIQAIATTFGTDVFREHDPDVCIDLTRVDIDDIGIAAENGRDDDLGHAVPGPHAMDYEVILSTRSRR